MKHKVRFVGWAIFTAGIVALGFHKGWSSFEFLALGLSIIYGFVLALSIFGDGPLMRRIAAMSSKDRDEFMAQFAEEERLKLTVKLKNYLDRHERR